MDADGSTPFAAVHGDYAKTGAVANGRAVYGKVGFAKRAMWYCTVQGGKWVCGTLDNLGTHNHYASVLTAAASPERTAGAVGEVYIGGKWIGHEAVAATAVSEDNVETERRRREGEAVAALVQAADYVRIAGAVGADGSTPWLWAPTAARPSPP